jgi:uncharacterized protein (TIGR02147 family)
VRGTRYATKIREEQYEYYAAWYHSAIRSLIGIYGFKGNYESLSRMVSPPISPSQAEKSVELLKKLGLIEKCSHGSYQVSSKAITSGDLPSFTLAVANFQQETMKLAWEAHDRYPKDKRNISSVTLGISERGVEEITKEMKMNRQTGYTS